MSALMTCKVCQREVARSARTCPHCGAVNPGVNTAKGCLLIVIFGAILGVSVWFFSDSGHGPEVVGGTARDYEITQREDNSYKERTRLRWYIVSDAAKTFEDRAATVIKAAVDLRLESFPDEAYVLMDISKDLSAKGYVVATADYVPNRKDARWEVKAIDQKEIQFDQNKVPFIPPLKDVQIK